MDDPRLAILLKSENGKKEKFQMPGENIIFPGQTLSFEFASPAKEATDVRVEVLETISSLPGYPDIKDRLLGAVDGSIKGGKFIPERMEHRKIVPYEQRKWSACIWLDHDNPEWGTRLQLPLPSAEEVKRHQLAVNVKGIIKGEPVSFQSKRMLDVRYPLAMVVPRGHAFMDTSLNYIRDYGPHWKSFEPKIRHVFGVDIVVTKNVPKPGTPSLFDGVIAALDDAAKSVPETGVVALSIGHGGGDVPGELVAGTPFVEFLPEDNLEAATKRSRIGRTFSKTMIIGEKRSESKLSDVQKLQLDALDRAADVLNGGMKRLVLNTCNAGLDGDFIQRIADRLQVPVVGQRKYIEFGKHISSKGVKPFCVYTGEEPDDENERQQKHWPTQRLGTVRFPGKKPWRSGPP